VRWLENSGARVVPILYGGDWDETLEKLDHLNGVLFCGGSATSKDYIAFGKQIFEQAIQKNDEGNYFPLWGTCLGFEDLA
jgi:gamma-glutamyl hydrolase